MKRLLSPSYLVLPLLSCLFFACNEEGEGGLFNKTYSYSGTVEIIYQTYRRFPDGTDTVMTSTESFSDILEVKKTGDKTYKIVKWESGCNLNICCIQPPCPGFEFELSENNRFHWNWDYDFDNDLTLIFDFEEDKMEARYMYGDGYFNDVYDENDDTKILYSDYKEEHYTFTGQRQE